MCGRVQRDLAHIKKIEEELFLAKEAREALHVCEAEVERLNLRAKQIEKLQTQSGEISKMQAECERLLKDYKILRKEEEKSAALYRAQNRMYLDGQAGILAEMLKSGVYHKEFIQIPGGNGDEFQPLKEWICRDLCFIQHPAVEVDP